MVDDLPIVLWWSLLIAGLTTLKASVPRGTGGSSPCVTNAEGSLM
jgi:hypothetical protein